MNAARPSFALCASLVAALALSAGACTRSADEKAEGQTTGRSAAKEFSAKEIAAQGKLKPLKPIDFKLLSKARHLAHEAIIVDGHVDLPYRLQGGMEEGKITEDVSQRTEEGDFDLPRAEYGGLDAPFMSIYTPAKHEAYEKKGQPKFDGPKALADELIDMVYDLAEAHPDKLVVAKTPNEVRAAHKAGKIALPLGMENGSPLEGKLENLRHFSDRGVNYITLAHSKDNHLADSSYDERHTNGGLTKFGKEVVKAMNDLGVMVDVSHLSDAAIEQVLEVSRAPVIASHSSCRHFTPGFERNISDDLIQKVSAKGGVVMINFGSTFVDDELRKKAHERWEAWKKVEADKEWASEEETHEAKKAFYEKNKVGYSDVKKVADHIEHVIKLVGVEHVGFGSDFDGVGDSLPVGLKDVSAYPNLIAELLGRGYSEEDVKRIAGENALRVWQQVEDAAKPAQTAKKTK